MLTIQNVSAIILAYLLGSISPLVWIGQIAYGIDIRGHGSGNSGATNTFRILGKKTGIIVLAIDVLKGWMAVHIAFILGEYSPETIPFTNFQLALGIAALLGHIFPIYVGFKGGKGIATLLGITIALYLESALISMGIFLAVFIIFRYVSLGSILAAVAFPISVIVLFNTTTPSLIDFSLFIAILVLITHRKNINRLIRGIEPRLKLSLKKKDIPDVDDDD